MTRPIPSLVDKDPSLPCPRLALRGGSLNRYRHHGARFPRPGSVGKDSQGLDNFYIVVPPSPCLRSPSSSLALVTFDGLAFVIDALVKKCWRQHTSTLGVNSFTGLLASSSLAAVGTWKDIEGVEVWSLKRMKIVAYLSFILDVAQAVLYGTSMHKGCMYIFPSTPYRNLTLCFSDLPHPHPFPSDYQTLLHFFLLTLRILLLLLLLAIINPIMKGTTATSSDTLEDGPTSTPLLQFPQESVDPPRGEGPTVHTGSGNYGTFEGAIYSATRLAPSSEAPDHTIVEIQVSLTSPCNLKRVTYRIPLTYTLREGTTNHPSLHRRRGRHLKRAGSILHPRPRSCT